MSPANPESPRHGSAASTVQGDPAIRRRGEPVRRASPAHGSGEPGRARVSPASAAMRGDPARAASPGSAARGQPASAVNPAARTAGEPGERGEPGAAGLQAPMANAANWEPGRGENGERGEAGGPVEGLAGGKASSARSARKATRCAGAPASAASKGETGERGPPGLLPVAKLYEPGTVCYAAQVVTAWRLAMAGDEGHRTGAAACRLALPRARGRRRRHRRRCAAPIARARPIARSTSSPSTRVASSPARTIPARCPGDGWQLLTAHGAAGEKGVRGERGERGLRGEPGPTHRALVDRPRAATRRSRS